jgi:nicotinamide mononucleotide transporter PnuC
MATATGNIGINNHDRLVKAYGSNANRIELLNKLKKQSKFTLIWYCIFITLGLVCLIIDPSSWFNVLDLFIVMINIDLVARGKLIGIYVGVAECLFYAFICYKSQLFGEVIKVLCISVPLNIYSIISWTIAMKKQKKEKYTDSTKDDEIVIKKLTKKQLAIYIALIAIVSGLSFCLLKFLVGQKNALILSSVSLALTIIGKILTAKRYMESYVVFNVGNAICLLMWVQTIIQTGFSISELSMTVYTLACLTNDIYAYGLWKSMYRKVAVNGGVLLAMRKVNIKKIIKLRRRFRNLRWNKEIDVNKNS